MPEGEGGELRGLAGGDSASCVTALVCKRYASQSLPRLRPTVFVTPNERDRKPQHPKHKQQQQSL